MGRGSLRGGGGREGAGRGVCEGACACVRVRSRLCSPAWISHQGGGPSRADLCDTILTRRTFDQYGPRPARPGPAWSSRRPLPHSQRMRPPGVTLTMLFDVVAPRTPQCLTSLTRFTRLTILTILTSLTSSMQMRPHGQCSTGPLPDAASPPALAATPRAAPPPPKRARFGRRFARSRPPSPKRLHPAQRPTRGVHAPVYARALSWARLDRDPYPSPLSPSPLPVRPTTLDVK